MKRNSNKMALILARVSTEMQSLESQIEKLIDEAKHFGYDENNITIISGKESGVKLDIDERLTIQQLKKYIDTEKYDMLFIWEVSRLARRPKVLYEVREYLIERRVNLHCMTPQFTMLKDDFTIDPTASIVFALFGTMAEEEARLTKARMRRGVEKAKAMGRHAGGHVTFGYKVDKQHIYHIDEEQAEIVRWVFDSYVNGWSMRRIARELIERGIFKCTFLTGVQNINNMIHNDIYTGTHIGRKQIITKETFNKAQDIRKRKTYHGEKKEIKRICKGLLYDRNNGFVLSVNNINEVYFSKRAKGVAVTYKVIEPIVWEWALKKYKSIYILNTKERAKHLLEDIITLNIKINNANEKIEEKKRQLDKLEERIILGKVSEALANKLGTQLNSELNELMNKVTGWKIEEDKKQDELRNINANMTSEIQPDGSTYYETQYDASKMQEITDIDEQIALVRQVIDKIILDRPARNLLNIEFHFKDNTIKKIQIDSFRRN